MAIDDLLDEHEQSERVLEWLRTNGAGLIGGIVLGLAAIGGWKWWQQHDLQQDLAAADSYHAAVSAIEANDEQAAAKVAALEDGVFANLSALELAAAQVDAGEIDKAIVTLRAIKPGNPAVADDVNQRLARLLIATDQADAALASLADASTPSALEVRGDAQQALGQEIVTEIAAAPEFWPAEDYHQDFYEKNPLRYKFYRNGCGRDARLVDVWGDAAMQGIEGS